MDNSVDDDLDENEAYDGLDEPPPPLSTWVRLIALLTVVAVLIASIWWVSIL